MRRFMKWLSLMSIYSIAFLMVPLVFAEDLTTLVNNQLSGLVEIYKDLHAHPELSHQESRTSALLATELRKAGYVVTEHIGKYSDGTNAYGVVAVLENAPGPRLLIRGDMDALPVVEETGLGYASHVRAKNLGRARCGSYARLRTRCSCDHFDWYSPRARGAQEPVAWNRHVHWSAFRRNQRRREGNACGSYL